MFSQLDPRKFQLGTSYRFFYRKLDKLPKTKWTLGGLLGVLVLLDHWFFWPVLIGVVIALVGWLIRLVIFRTGRH